MSVGNDWLSPTGPRTSLMRDRGRDAPTTECAGLYPCDPSAHRTPAAASLRSMCLGGRS